MPAVLPPPHIPPHILYTAAAHHHYCITQAKQDATELQEQSKVLKASIAELEEKEQAIIAERDAALVPIGNIVHDSVPISDNEVGWGRGGAGGVWEGGGVGLWVCRSVIWWWGKQGDVAVLVPIGNIVHDSVPISDNEVRSCIGLKGRGGGVYWFGGCDCGWEQR